jgi:acyl dehydratase
MLLRALLKQRHRDAPHHVQASYLFEGIAPGHVARYNKAFGFADGTVSLTYLYLIAQRAQLATMLDRPLPFRIPGLIHVDNSLVLHSEAAPLSRPLVVSTEVRLLAPEPNGAVLCAVNTDAWDGGTPVFGCASTYLVKRGGRREGDAQRPALPTGAPLGAWRLAQDAGRRYAALSGDWNPIHLWPWSARLMGMKKPIIHGMHTAAQACAMLERDAGKRVNAMNCRFTSPAPLGEEVQLFTRPEPGGFAAVCGGRVALDGKLSLA